MLKILLVLGPALISLLQLGLDSRFHDKRTIIHRRVRFTTEFLIIAIAILAACIVYKDEQKAFENEIRADEKIKNLSLQIESWIGGNGFTYIEILPRDGYLLLLAKNDGDYPIYDATFSVIDLNALKRMTSQMKIEAVQEATTIFQGGNVAPHSSKVVGRFDFGSVDKYALNIVVDARNGQTVQELRLARGSDGWKSAFRVRKGHQELGESYLLEKSDKDYPLNRDGTVEWYK